jgi:gliding motility-associated-like protein
VQCFGGSNGTIDLSVTGGAAPYTYQWTGPNGYSATTQDISNVPAGNSTVIITDANGCTSTFVAAVSQPSAPLTINSNVIGIGCFGAQSGNIDLTIIGGTPGYSYVWNNTQTTQDLVGVNPGTYSVQVYDTNGCFATDTFVINQIASPIVLQITGSNVACFGGNTGSINLTVNGGAAPYTYNWNNGAFTQDIQGLLAGLYEVVVTDANGCLDSTSITITQPTQPLLFTSVLQNLNCFDQPTGSIDITVSGGVTPYNYIWTGPNGFSSNTQDISSMSAGGYSLTVTDFNGCSVTQTFVLTQPPTQAVVSATVNDILCYGATTGWINASVVGGSLPYQYFWQAPNGGLAGNTEDLFGIGAGWYELFVTDATGCVTSDSILVDSPGLISPNAVISNISCFGLSDGAINVSTTGGVQPYAFQWNTGAPSEDLSGLLPGTYTLVITDANNCVVTNSFTVTQPLAPLTLSLTQQNVNCYGDSTGSINLTPAGGTTPYSYAWSGPNGYTATTEDLNNLPIGTYAVLVTDTNGCTASTQTTLSQPLAALSLSEVHTNVSCFGGVNGSISISTAGGTAPYAYLWNNTQTTATVSGLPIGTYTVLVTDSLGCTATLSVTLTQPQAPLSVTSVVTDLICLNDPTGAIDVTVQGGTQGYTYSWSNGPTTEDIDSLESGPYTLTVTDMLGCVLTTTIEVNNPLNPMVVTPTQNNVSCHSYDDATLLLTITGGQPVYDILWSTGDTVNYLDSLTPGTYSVLVTDAQGCEEPLSFTVTEPAPIVANFVPSTTFGCIPLDVTFTNVSTGPYTNSTWDFGNTITQSTQNANTTLTIPGCYSITLTVYNAIGCADTITMDSLVCVVPGPQASFSASSGVIDYFTGLLELTNTSLGSVISTFWTFGDGSPNSTVENPVHYYPDQQPADYDVTLVVTDTNGCTDTASAVFTLIELLNVYIPNTITIDGDGVNDVFLPVFSNPDIIESYQIQIYNRWGNLVFETDNAAEGWDGRYKGKRDVQLGLYNWKIIYTDNKMVTRSLVGHVNVLR